MKYGLIGEKLGHSFSKIIHEQLADYTFDLMPLRKEEVPAFMKAKAFTAINVTIPYKETVLPYLDEIDTAAQTIGAVNTIVNHDGRLYGYNTDYYGFHYMLEKYHVAIDGKKILILGKGGAAKAVHTVVTDMGAETIHTVYYKPNPETITYEACYEEHSDAHVIINTTPVGMFPHAKEAPIDLTPFHHLEAVVDVVYNPLRTKFVLEGAKRGVKHVGGLEMLIAQAKHAVEIFLDTTVEMTEIERIYRSMLLERSNLILIGAEEQLEKAVAEATNKKYAKPFHTLLAAIDMPLQDYLLQNGQAALYALEDAILGDLAEQNNLVLSVNEASALRPDNHWYLQTNGILIWIQNEDCPCPAEADHVLDISGLSLEESVDAICDIYHTVLK